MPAIVKARIVRVVTLDVQRRHLKSCSKYGTSQDCPSASKKKCPYRLFGVGIDEHGQKVKIRKALRTNNQTIAAEELIRYRSNVEALNAPVALSAITVGDAIAKYFERQTAET